MPQQLYHRFVILGNQPDLRAASLLKCLRYNEMKVIASVSRKQNQNVFSPKKKLTREAVKVARVGCQRFGRRMAGASVEVRFADIKGVAGRAWHRVRLVERVAGRFTTIQPGGRLTTLQPEANHPPAS